MAKKITYKKAGVDIDKAESLIKGAKKMIASTNVKGSVGTIGGFGGFFDPRKAGFKDPLFVSGTDGVGTKLKIAQMTGRHGTIGIDLVAMCVNDILCSGAKPLFFLDYYATGKLSAKEWNSVMKGIVKGCRQAGCVLLGGETAEMPGMYGKGEYDLAGFAVGAVDRKKVIDGSKLKAGDVLLGLPSSGFHSNGYSLVRKVFSRAKIKKHHKLFLKPTVIYAKPVMALLDKVRIKAAAHITGGGIYDNIPRVLPANLKAVVKKGSWSLPKVFRMVKEEAGLKDPELYRTFNMGIGMVLVLSGKDAERAQKVLAEKFKMKARVIGELVKGKRGVEII
ncbi:MAG: phosphoribosylformylglycinamidine cyclo-ligase [Candidatus Omnitrophica bacterium]|nr:phosphoribosylformylglycinamidine cyclo-ligase [Candidatus Omnitrophota bacterium]